MTALQAKMTANAALNAARWARAAARRTPVSPSAALLAGLRAAVESTDEYGDGSKWGQVYLPNVGKGHSFAGLLSALEGQGLYRPTGNPAFGMVRLA